MGKLTDRFLKYISINTQSDEKVKSCPSTKGQLELAKILVEELREIGLSNINMDKNGYVTAFLPSNIKHSAPVVGFIAHMDTSPDISGNNVNPQIIDQYFGKNIVLDKKANIILSSREFPVLNNYIGQSIITTDGKTLLGADDKAGIAEIVTAMEYLTEHPEIKHGKIRIAFTPDEEIGRGADKFDVKKFNADFAYTLDGGPIG
jgi:tripeptide aminopeptidase